RWIQIVLARYIDEWYGASNSRERLNGGVIDGWGLRELIGRWVRALFRLFDGLRRSARAREGRFVRDAIREAGVRRRGVVAGGVRGADALLARVRELRGVRRAV